jgi:HK97 family phage portal protein
VLVRRAAGLLEHRANTGAPFGDSTPPPPGGYMGSMAAGTVVNEHSALQLTSVYGSVALISDTIATLPIKQWRQTGFGGQPVETPLSPVIAQPWSEITRRDFVTQGTMSILLRGNLWGRIVSRDPDGYPSQVQLVHPDHAHARRMPDGSIEIRYWDQIVPPAQVTRARGMSVPEAVEGLSPIHYLRNSLGLARAQDLWANSFFANSARPDGYISVPDDLDPDEVKAMLTAWMASHQGINQSHLPGMLTGGAQWNAITMSMADTQFLQQMQYSASVISGMIYRVPPHMLGMTDATTSWGAGIEQQELGYVRNTLLIWLNRWEDLLSSWLPAGECVTFDMSERLRGDSLQRWSGYQIARVMGAMNNAEVREAENLPPITDPEAAEILGAYDAPLNSAPVKAMTSSGAGPGGDEAD